MRRKSVIEKAYRSDQLLLITTKMSIRQITLNRRLLHIFYRLVSNLNNDRSLERADR